MTCSKESLRLQYQQIRAHSLSLASGLTAEDQCIQSMSDASPTKWHLAHTTWFFEAMLLRPYAAQYRVFDSTFHYLFNSYYEALGPRQPRPQRGMLSRPGLDAVHAYRQHVDAAMDAWLEDLDDTQWQVLQPIAVLGLQHEQQHQELIVTDILHALSCNPLLPAYRENASQASAVSVPPDPVRWLAHDGAMVDIGHSGPGFAFDNETPRHPVWLQPYAIADRLVTCGEYLD